MTLKIEKLSQKLARNWKICWFLFSSHALKEWWVILNFLLLTVFFTWIFQNMVRHNKQSAKLRSVVLFWEICFSSLCYTFVPLDCASDYTSHLSFEDNNETILCTLGYAIAANKPLYAPHKPHKRLVTCFGINSGINCKILHEHEIIAHLLS